VKFQNFVLWQWRYARGFLVIWFILIAAITGTNIWNDHAEGKPMQWELVPIAIGMMAFGAALVWLMRHWFNFMLGEELCKWRDSK
jgi:hypothetical protein